MKFYFAAARVILVALSLLVAFTIIGGIVIIAVSLLRGYFDLDRILAILGVFGGIPLWVVVSILWRWVNKKLR